MIGKKIINVNKNAAKIQNSYLFMKFDKDCLHKIAEISIKIPTKKFFQKIDNWKKHDDYKSI